MTSILDVLKKGAHRWLQPEEKTHLNASGSNWMVRISLVATLAALMLTTPLTWLFLPEMLNYVIGLTILVSLVITPLISYQTGQVIARLEQEQEKLIFLANHDQMTGLMNRSHFFHELGLLQKACILKQQPLGIITLDIDNFKAINDCYGHAAGDEVITGLANLMQNLAPQDAFIGRTGGEEFFLALPGDYKRVERLTRILCQMAPSVRLANTKTTISAGFVIGTNEDPSELCMKADNAMYLAKRAGRNCYRAAA